MFMPGSFPGAMPPSMDMRGIEMLHPSMPQPPLPQPMPQGPMGGLLGPMSPDNLFNYGAMQGLAPIRPPQPMPTPPVQRLPMPQGPGLGSLSPMANGMGQTTNPFAMPPPRPMSNPMTGGIGPMPTAGRPGAMPPLPMPPVPTMWNSSGY